MEFEIIEKEQQKCRSENKKNTFRKFEFPEESLMHCWLSLKQVMSSSCRSAGSAMVVDVNSGVWAENLKMFPKKVENMMLKQNVSRFGCFFSNRVSVQETERRNVNVSASWNM